MLLTNNPIHLDKLGMFCAFPISVRTLFRNVRLGQLFKVILVVNQLQNLLHSCKVSTVII